MADNKIRESRRLIKSLGITFKPPDLKHWPASHRHTFEDIHKIRNQKFEDYCPESTGGVTSSEHPWRYQTKRRAEWLAKRSADLTKQTRSEAGWRFALENDILRRFYIEVAWLV